MSRPPLLSEEDIEQIKTLYRQGRKLSYIAAVYLVDRKTIHYHLFHAGLLHKKPKKERRYIIVKPKPKAVVKRKTEKNIWLWRDFPNERKYPRSYAEYAKKKGIKLKKYMREHSLIYNI